MKSYHHTTLVCFIALVMITCFTVKLQAFQTDEEPLILDTETDDIDGFKVDKHLADFIDEEVFTNEEQQFTERAAKEEKHVFEKKCPNGYFTCLSGECIAPKWRCDGHYDCDDFSDELNCTTIEIPKASQMKLDHPVMTQAVSRSTTTTTTPKPQPAGEEITDLKFNSPYEPLMLFSTGASIRGYWMQSRIYFDVFSMTPRKAPKIEQTSITQALSVFFGILNPDRPQTDPKDGETAMRSKNTIVGVDMDPGNKEVYWVELGRDAGVFSTAIDKEQFESRHRRQFSQRKTLVDSGLIAPEDIALDTLARNIYITDAGLPAIVVCSIKNSHFCKMIVKDKIHKPRAIIADSSTGWLTYTDWGDHPGIFLVSMDGKRRETLIDTDVVWPNGLAADYTTNQLYWADARLSKIERIDLITKKRRVVIKEAASNPFSLTLFENRIFWSDWSGNDIRTCDKLTGNDTKAIMRTESLYGIHIYHPSLHPKGELENPCWSKYCSHMCLLSSPTTFVQRKAGSLNAVCACPESMALSIGDKATCYEVQLSFLLLNVKNYIGQVWPDEIGLHAVQEVVYSREHVIHDIAADWVNYRLFFFDVAKQWIYTLSLKSKTTKIEPFVRTGKSIRSLLYDPPAENLYWLDADNGTLSVCSIRTRHEIVLRRDLERPISMVFDSKNQVFYISMLVPNPHIMRTNALGQESSDLIIVGSGLGIPVSLHLDEQRLYWADAKLEWIESVDLDPKSTTTGIKKNSRIRHKSQLGTILAFTVHDKHFFWMVKYGNYLYKAKIEDQQEGSELRQVNLKLPPNTSRDPPSDNMRIVLVQPRAFGGDLSHRCNIGCSHGCVIVNNTGICICPSGYQIDSRNRTNCIIPIVTTPLPTPPPEVHPFDASTHEFVSHSVESHDTASHDIGSHDITPHHSAIHKMPSHDAISHDTISHDAISHSSIPHEIVPHEASSSPSPSVSPLDGHADALGGQEEAGSGVIWLIVLLLILSITGLVTLGSLLILYKQGRLPRQVSQLSVSFMSQHEKDGAVLLLDD